ncbi:helix-turn-helix domain-containing protein [Nocardioides dongxiaopingii]|uniref:helix-turn-helix domain-containing protein n=1 Tax=Nocardioides dongxiaopingii TaxID=2576036 RepID=UPI0010C76A39|nr:helix-turn-helix transcriptional regulator [Nocardioides dongxiaopingii]
MTKKTEVDELLEDSRHRVELAAARVINAVGGLMDRALLASIATGRRQHEIARDMGVSSGRITQLLSAKGNVKVSTLARYMDACGYDLKISATPQESGMPSLEPKRRVRRTDQIRTAAPSVAPDFFSGEITVESFFPAPAVPSALTEVHKQTVAHLTAVAWGRSFKLGTMMGKTDLRVDTSRYVVMYDHQASEGVDYERKNVCGYPSGI